MAVNIHEAKTHLSRLLRRVQAGEEIVIASNGRPIAKLVPISPPPQERVPGSGTDFVLWMLDDFDDPMPEEFMRHFG